MKTSPRSQKLSGVIKTQLPGIIQKLTSPNQVGFLTISAIEVSGDLSLADAFVSFLGSPPEAFKNLQKITPKIEYELNKGLSLPRLIRLRFKRDKSAEHVKTINNLLPKQ